MRVKQIMLFGAVLMVACTLIGLVVTYAGGQREQAETGWFAELFETQRPIEVKDSMEELAPIVVPVINPETTITPESKLWEPNFVQFFNEDCTEFDLEGYLESEGTDVEVSTIYAEPVWVSVKLPSGDEVQVTLVADFTTPQITINRTDEWTYRADLKPLGDLILVDSRHEKYIHEETLWTLFEVIDRLGRYDERECPFAEMGITHWSYPTYDVRVQALHED